jgi:hypothetical protein
MDIAIDNTVFSRLAEDPDGIAQALVTKVIGERCRIVVSTTILDESFSDSNHERAVGRARMLCRIAEVLGSRFVLAGGVGDVIKAERATVLSSTPMLSAKYREDLLKHLQSPMLGDYLPAVVSDFRALLGKNLTHAADLKARSAGANRFPKFEAKDLDAFLDLPNSQLFWTSSFVEQATAHGRWRQAARERPRRHRAAITMAAYTFMNGISSLFGDFPYGEWAGILRAPRPGDWVDAAIAASAAYSRVFLTEDEGQRKRASYVWKQFGYPIEALPLRSWLSRDRLQA